MPGTLYLVATPIGNLQDITYRALETLRQVNVIACEDTRHTRNLLTHFRVSNRVLSYHEFNELERADELADRLLRGESVAVVSDAGTPGICDPGYRLVQRAIEVGVQVVSIPGPAAFVSAAVASGLPTDALFFGGFLPSKKGERKKRLTETAVIPATLIFYEAPHRLGKSLADCLEVLGNRRAAVARELTKLHEEVVRGSLGELAGRYAGEKVKGEVVLVIERGESDQAPPAQSAGSIADRVAALILEGLDNKAALKKAAKEFNISRSEAYRRLIAAK